MPIKFFDIVDNLNFLIAGGGSADALGKWNDKTAVPALVRPNLQYIRSDNTVKPNPIKPINFF